MYGKALAIRQLASEGKTEEVILEVVKLNPDFFEQNPHLLFQLKQVRLFFFPWVLGSMLKPVFHEYRKRFRLRTKLLL